MQINQFSLLFLIILKYKYNTLVQFLFDLTNFYDKTFYLIFEIYYAYLRGI